MAKKTPRKKVEKLQIVMIVEKINRLRESFLQREPTELEVENWQNSQGDLRSKKVIDEELVDAITELATLTKQPNQAFGSDCVSLVLACDGFLEQFGKFAIDRFRDARIEVDPGGPHEVWAEWETVQAEKKIHPANTQSLALLVKEGHGMETVMNMLEMRDHEGLRHDWFQKEMEKPGSIINENWNPGVQAELNRFHYQWEERGKVDPESYKEWQQTVSLGSLEDELTARNRDEPVEYEQAEPAPESIQELAAQDVSLEQIQMLKADEIEAGISAERGSNWEVRTGSIESDRIEWLIKHLIEKGWKHPDPRVKVGQEDKQRQFNEQLEQANQVNSMAHSPEFDTYKVPGFDVPTRIKAMTEDGHKPMKIAAALAAEGQEIDPKEVQKIWNAHQKELAKHQAEPEPAAAKSTE